MWFIKVFIFATNWVLNHVHLHISFDKLMMLPYLSIVWTNYYYNQFLTIALHFLWDCWEQQNHASYIKIVVNRKSIKFCYGWVLSYLTYVVFSRRCCNEKIIENISVSIYMSQFKITCKTRYENYLMNCLSTVSVFHAKICNV